MHVVTAPLWVGLHQTLGIINHNPMSVQRPHATSNVKYKNPDNDPRGPYVLADVTSPFERPNLQYRWQGRLPPNGRSWRYNQERAKALEEEGRIVFSITGSPRLKRYLDEVQALNLLQPANTASKTVDLILRPAMRALAKSVAENPSCLHQMEWRDLERMLREVFEEVGFQTELTRSSKDGGFDLRLNTDSITYLVEVKHWINSNKKPGRKEITALFDVVVISSEAQAGLLLSTTGFTEQSVRGRTEIQQQTIRLGGENKIVSLCQEYVQSSTGLWAPTSDLAQLLLENTY